MKTLMFFAIALCLAMLPWFLNRTAQSTSDNDNASISATPVPIQPKPTLNLPTVLPSSSTGATNSRHLTTMNEKPTDTQKQFEERDLIIIAYEEAKKSANIPLNVRPKVTYNGDVAEITWFIDWPPDVIYPRGDFHALVQIDRKSGKILKIWGPP